MTDTLPKSAAPAEYIEIGSIDACFRDARVLPGLVLDEVRVSGTGPRLQWSQGAGTAVCAVGGESKLRVVLSEKNLNAYLSFVAGAFAPASGLHATVLTGKVTLSGKLSKVVALPFSLDVAPRIENGVRLRLEWQGMRAVGITLPSSLRAALEHQLNRALDLSSLPVPVWVDEVRCEPARITALGRAKLNWPPEEAHSENLFSLPDAVPAQEQGAGPAGG